MVYKIAVLPGDGIGPEIVSEAVKVLQACAQKFGLTFKFREAPVGGTVIEAAGHPLPEETLALCRKSDAVLLGAIGGPQWDHLPVERRPEAGALLPLRQKLGLFANLRPVILYEALIDASPLKREIVEGTEILVIRELTGGLYFGEKKRQKVPGGEQATDTLVYTTRRSNGSAAWPLSPPASGEKCFTLWIKPTCWKVRGFGGGLSTGFQKIFPKWSCPTCM